MDRKTILRITAYALFIAGIVAMTVTVGARVRAEAFVSPEASFTVGFPLTVVGILLAKIVMPGELSNFVKIGLVFLVIGLLALIL